MIAQRPKGNLPAKAGFTLVELSIVLVIIGLIVGGVLVGRDLIIAAAIRAQISQIQKFQSAVNTFRGKYGYLPGDIPDPAATQFGFKPRGPNAGMGDGDGIVTGIACCSGVGGGHPYGAAAASGEAAMFWVDLSTAALIDGGFSVSNPTGFYTLTLTSSPKIADIFPAAKIGGGNYIYVYCGGYANCVGIDYFGISAVSAGYDLIDSLAGMSVAQAYALDSKIDDGYPMSGRVVARYLDYSVGFSSAVWANGGGTAYENQWFSTGSSITCFDWRTGTSSVAEYSNEISNGGNINCGLLFQFQ